MGFGSARQRARRAEICYIWVMIKKRLTEKRPETGRFVIGESFQKISLVEVIRMTGDIKSGRRTRAAKGCRPTNIAELSCVVIARDNSSACMMRQTILTLMKIQLCW